MSPGLGSVSCGSVTAILSQSCHLEFFFCSFVCSGYSRWANHLIDFNHIIKRIKFAKQTAASIFLQLHISEQQKEAEDAVIFQGLVVLNGNLLQELKEEALVSFSLLLF